MKHKNWTEKIREELQSKRKETVLLYVNTAEHTSVTPRGQFNKNFYKYNTNQ